MTNIIQPTTSATKTLDEFLREDELRCVADRKRREQELSSAVREIAHRTLKNHGGIAGLLGECAQLFVRRDRNPRIGCIEPTYFEAAADVAAAISISGLPLWDCYSICADAINDVENGAAGVDGDSRG